mmetsp:Transcript_24662/g.79827  ORF Transcript_24662/g.79827 Transcript_24662/m.79827 type:complete len:142 (-) Transcript_24662:343-768(-)
MASNLLVGLRRLLGGRALDFPRWRQLYARAVDEGREPRGDLSTTGLLAEPPPAPVGARNASGIALLLAARAFDAVIYSNARAPLPFWDVVRSHYAPSKVAFLDGHDHLNASRVLELAPLGRYFVREMAEGCPIEGYEWSDS